MKQLLFFALAALLLAGDAFAETAAITGGTLINPGRAQVLPHAVIVIKDDHIVSAGRAKDIKIPAGAKTIDAKGRFILPGYIDTHVHFFQSGGLYTRPDVLDLTKVRPYSTEVAMIKQNLPDTFERYLRSGITSVVDVGGPMWNFEVRKIANATVKAPRVAVAGPLISSVARPQLDLGDPPIVKSTRPNRLARWCASSLRKSPITSRFGTSFRRPLRVVPSGNEELHKPLLKQRQDKATPLAPLSFGPSFMLSWRKVMPASCASLFTRPNWKPPAPRSKKTPTCWFTALPTNRSTNHSLGC